MTAASSQRAYTLTRERRASRRFPIQVELTFKVRHKGRAIASGSGQTVDLSSRGARILTDQSLSEGAKVELCIAWPAVLHDGVALNLFVSGQVVRCGDSGAESYAAIAFQRYMFRIRAVRKKAESETHTYTFLA